jgi:hypothetical protein
VLTCDPETYLSSSYGSFRGTALRNQVIVNLIHHRDDAKLFLQFPKDAEHPMWSKENGGSLGK